MFQFTLPDVLTYYINCNRFDADILIAKMAKRWQSTSDFRRAGKIKPPTNVDGVYAGASEGT